MKKVILWILTAALCLTACGSAFAAAGDRTLTHMRSDDGYMMSYISNVFVTEEGVVAHLNGQHEKIAVYREGEEPAEYLLEEEDTFSMIPASETEDPTESRYMQSVGWFSWQGNLYAIQVANYYGGETSRIEGGFVKKAVLADGKVTLEDCDIPQLDWTGMTEDYGGGNQGTRYLNRLIVTGNLLVGSTYDNNGEHLLMLFDLTDGSATDVPLQDVDGIFPGGEGTLLMTRYDWSDESPKELILRYDLASQSEEILGSVSLMNGQIQGVCLDEKNGTLYFAMDGEIRAARDMNIETAEAVSDCPLSYDATMQMLDDGRILLWNQNAIVIRNPDPAAKGDNFTLRIQDMIYADALQEAVYDFTDARGDASVVISRGSMASGILQAMMNRDAETDIYALYYDSSEFDALRNRGFLADLSANESLSAAVSRMYSFTQDALQQNGKLTAVPVYMSGQTLGIHKNIWEKLGGTEEELPKTWNQFFDWLESLPARVEGTDYAVFDQWIDRQQFRSNLLNILLNQYQTRLNEGGLDYAFNTPLLRGLLDRMDALDYDALKLAEPNYGEDGGMISYDEYYHEPLLDVYTDVTMESWSGAAQPLMLALEEGEEPILPVRLSVAFVNPYSEHAEAAAEFLAMSLKNIRKNTQYALFTDLQEPVRDPFYEENQKNLQQWLEEAKAQLEKDEENRVMWEDNIRNYEESLADNEKNSWMISPESIAAYEARVPNLKVLSYDFANAMMSSDNGGGDYYQMVWGYAQQQVSAQELLSGIDKKVQMMRLEGN